MLLHYLYHILKTNYIYYIYMYVHAFFILIFTVILQREQLQDHETRIVWLEKEYEELLSKTPEKSSKSRFAQECVEKEAHLLNEV